VLLVHREGEHSTVRDILRLRAGATARARRRREWGPAGIENERGPIPVVDVEVNDRGPLDAVPLQDPHGHGDIIERTEAFAMIWKGVVQPAADMT
jgi:hypothetical protein